MQFVHLKYISPVSHSKHNAFYYKDRPVSAVCNIFSVCSVKHTELINTFCDQNPELTLVL